MFERDGGREGKKGISGYETFKVNSVDPEQINCDYCPGLRAGTTFAGRYQIMSELGRGAICTVYLAHEAILDRKVALKVLKPSLISTQSARFRNEARTTSTLKHPNIVNILSCGADSEGTPYIAMEYLQGQTLEHLLAQEKGVGRERFAEIFMPVLSALVYAHSQNIVHRDLKPSNIMLCLDGESRQVKLLDFGIAKILEAANPENLQETLGFCGSPYYMSPEQCAGAKVDGRSDVYSLACVMYEVIVGKPPLAGETPLSTMYKHLNESISRLEEISGSLQVSRTLARSIMKALSRDPAQRQQSMSEFESEVAGSLSGGGIIEIQPGKLKLILAAAASALLLAVALSCFLIAGKNAAPISQGKLRPPGKRTAAVKPAIGVPSPGVNLPAIFSEIENLQARKDFKGAEIKCREAIRMGEQCRDDRPEWIFDAYQSLGLLYCNMNRFDEAGKQFRLALEVFPSKESKSRMAALDCLCSSLVSAGKSEEALQTYQQNLEAAEKSLEGEPEDYLASSYMSLSRLLESMGKRQEALAKARKGLNTYLQLPDYQHSNEMVNASWRVYGLCKQLGIKAEGKAVLEKCRHLLREPGPKPVSFAALAYVKQARLYGCPEDIEEMCKLSLADTARLHSQEIVTVRATCQEFLNDLKSKKPGSSR
jgi:tetratricopeptide (TPR) repeat protein/tRNA A-37 threonylcarbamoyl transferase component Bud32